jgi:hypothetical protein
MIAFACALLIGTASTVGFVRSIRREEGTRATVIEWVLSASVGILFGAGALALLR